MEAIAAGLRKVGDVGGPGGVVVSVNRSLETGTKKENVGCSRVLEGHGLEGDAHAGDWHRQVSLLAVESIGKMREHGADVGPGDFGENLTTRGIDLTSLPVGTTLRVGDGTILEVTQIGKECHDRCAIYYTVGDCVMPREGIFASVSSSGEVKVGDTVEVVEEPGEGA